MTTVLPRAEVPEADGMTEVDEQVYHDDLNSLSVTWAKLLLPPSCPAKFRHAQHNPPKVKKVWDFGALAHKIVLGKGREFEVLEPAIHGLKADGTASEKPTATAAWKQAEAAARHRGATPVHVDDFATAKEMAAEVLEHPIVGPWFQRGHAEKAFYTHDLATGVRLRGRIDWLTLINEQPGGDRLYAVEYKTSVTADPVQLVRTFYRLGYYMQAAWYTDLIIALGLHDNPRFVFVVQEKEPPYLVTPIEYDEEAITAGRRANREAIDLYARCRDTNTWPGYADEPVTISLPPWAIEEEMVIL